MKQIVVVLCHDVPVLVAKMRVEMKDGSVVLEEHDSSVPMTDLDAAAKVERKFFALVEPILGE